MQGIIDESLKHGARLLTGGKRIARKGWFFEPTVLADVPNSARIMNEEPFGPIAILNPFRDFDAVMAEANRLPYGLAAFGFTNNAQRVNLLGERLEAGMIGLNSFQISVPESPFGGVKESGHGSEEGIEGLEALPCDEIHQSVVVRASGIARWVRAEPLRDFLHVRLEGAGCIEVEYAGADVTAILEIVFDAAGNEYERSCGRMDPFFAGEQTHGAFEHVEDVVFGM